MTSIKSDFDKEIVKWNHKDVSTKENLISQEGFLVRYGIRDIIVAEWNELRQRDMVKIRAFDYKRNKT